MMRANILERSRNDSAGKHPGAEIVRDFESIVNDQDIELGVPADRGFDDDHGCKPREQSADDAAEQGDPEETIICQQPMD